MRGSKAARFYSVADVKEFAEENHVAFNNLTNLGRKDFADLEMQGEEPFDNYGSDNVAHDDDNSSC
jgi:hypothetical protein